MSDPVRELFPNHTRIERPVLCPLCGHRNDMIDPTGESTKPTDDEPAILFCGQCVVALLINGSYEPHVMTIAELDAIPTDERRRVVEIYRMTHAARIAAWLAGK